MKQSNNTINILPSEEETQKSGTFFCNNKTNTPLTGQILSMSELKTYIRVKFIDYKEAAAAANISPGRVRQIVNGHELPLSPVLIKQIADGWRIDSIKLALLFERERK